MNLTDNEIIKAFGNLYKKLLDVRYDLKITAKEFQALNSVNALVNRQKAENERLQKLLEQCEDSGEYWESKYIDAIKEFAERLKSMFHISCDYTCNYVRQVINDLVKELTDDFKE